MNCHSLSQPILSLIRDVPYTTVGTGGGVGASDKYLFRQRTSIPTQAFLFTLHVCKFTPRRRGGEEWKAIEWPFDFLKAIWTHPEKTICGIEIKINVFFAIKMTFVVLMFPGYYFVLFLDYKNSALFKIHKQNNEKSISLQFNQKVHY